MIQPLKNYPGPITDSPLQEPKGRSFRKLWEILETLSKFSEFGSESFRHMPVGPKGQIFIPSELTYGEQEVERKIKTNASLIFELRLLTIR